MSYSKIFFAYPGGHNELNQAINAAEKLINVPNGNFGIKIWPQLDTFGLSIPDEIRSAIDESDIVACDITIPNLNVYYEVGFAIGRGKSIAPVVNVSFQGAREDVQRDGIFDNIGYKPYENAAELHTALAALPTGDLISLFSKPVNFQQPLYFLSAFRKTDFINAIASAIKEANFFRSFDPVETPRFSTVPVIADATASAGLIIPFLGHHIEDSARHNLRAAFLAGLAHGLERKALLLRLQTTEKAAADYRDLVHDVRNDAEINELVSEFAKEAMRASGSITSPKSRGPRSKLQQLFLGSSAAENEFRTLEEYFVETSEFVKTREGQVKVVAGRKGSGKTAIFFMVRNALRVAGDSVVTDLKPESHQLSMFRENLLKLVDVGSFDHTLAAFWYYLILSELLLTIKDNAGHKSRYDGKALQVTRDISELLDKQGVLESGDFTSRLNRLGSTISQEIERAEKAGERLIPEKLTNIVFRDAIVPIRDMIVKNTTEDTNIVLLFDNLDKGWPSSGVHEFDIRLLRLLLESLDKVGRDFATQHRTFMHVVFVRNDIYELLVGDTPDRGKLPQVRLDWTDRDKLRLVIYRRLQAALNDRKSSFQELWSKFFEPKVQNRDSFDFLVDHSLMRPRFLINLVENAVSFAVNRGHDLVNEQDCIDAARQHANILMDDFGYEIRDVSDLSEDILYALIGVTKYLTKAEVLERFSKAKVADTDLEQAFELMLWYGVLGIVTAKSEERFIYQFDYNPKRMYAEIADQNDMLFVVNEAFHAALN